ncbi:MULTISPECIES: hypothetical protein [unclassified Thioalkalivibrio]|uniref:hypothetical protein n=1 Tax=unclassified Thioalkalivibrio TaxID=2621013 RepID=UPI00035FE85D|nr:MULTISPECIES: hypothetical protein [unclassified Thioalkalivibrio]
MNLYRQFQRMIPRDPLLVAEVVSHNADGSSTLETPAGGIIRARGTDVAVGSNAYVQGGRVIEEAPDLPAYNETV